MEAVDFKRPSDFAQLPSQYQPGDKTGLQVLIDLMERAANAVVTKVSFSRGKVRYDLQIPIMDRIDGEVSGHFRIANVDSALTNEPFKNGFHYNSVRDREFRFKFDQEPVRTTPTILDGTTAYTSKEIPKQDPNEEDLSYYVLIDLNGYRKQADFEIGYYNFSLKAWFIKGDPDREIDLDHIRWMYMPIVELDN